MELKKRSEEASETPPLKEEKPKTRKQSQEAVIVYITILFTVVFLLTLLSYMMHQRENEDTINALTQSHTSTMAEMQTKIDSLETENEQLRARIAELENEKEVNSND